jgi:hypothetical protein
MRWERMDEWLVEKGGRKKVHNREEWKKHRILHMPMEWMNNLARGVKCIITNAWNKKFITEYHTPTNALTIYSNMLV